MQLARGLVDVRGASGWFTVQGVAGVGVGAYHTQTGSAAECTESNDVGATLLVVFVPVSTGPRSCAAEIPGIYDALP